MIIFVMDPQLPVRHQQGSSRFTLSAILIQIGPVVNVKEVSQQFTGFSIQRQPSVSLYAMNCRSLMRCVAVRALRTWLEHATMCISMMTRFLSPTEWCFWGWARRWSCCAAAVTEREPKLFRKNEPKIKNEPCWNPAQKTSFHPDERDSPYCEDGMLDDPGHESGWCRVGMKSDMSC